MKCPTRSLAAARQARGHPGLLVFVIGLALSGALCRKHTPPNNIVLISLDTQRADFLNCYVPGSARTPNLDGLAESGIRFRDCSSLIPITLPSHASVFFSEPPETVKNFNNGQVVRTRQSRPSLPFLFKKRGWTTAAFVSLGVLASPFGLAQGFDEYYDEFPEDRWYLHAEEVNRRVLPWLEKNSARPFFLWVHYSDPHDPYTTPDAPDDLRISFNGQPLGGPRCLSKYRTLTLDVKLKRGRNTFLLEVSSPYYPNNFQARLDLLEFSPGPDAPGIDIDFASGWFIRRADNIYFLKQRAVLDVVNDAPPRDFRMTLRGKILVPPDDIPGRYRQEVEYMDVHIGRLLQTLKKLGRFEDTAVVVFGDHGEGLGEFLGPAGDRHIGHIHYLYQNYMKVPLLLRLPGGKHGGEVRTEPVTLLDIAPTLTALMGGPQPSFYQGRDLLGRQPPGRGTFFQATYRPEAVWDKFAALNHPWHLIFTPQTRRFELFDLGRDPGERADLIESAAGRLPQVLTLRRELEAYAREVLKNKGDVVLEKSAEEMLRSLGYIRN